MVKNHHSSVKAWAILLLAVFICPIEISALPQPAGFGVRVDHGDKPVSGQDRDKAKRFGGQGNGPPTTSDSAPPLNDQATVGPATPP